MPSVKPRPLVAGNWKMNGIKASVGELEKIIKGAGRFRDKADILVCPPATLIATFAAAAAGSNKHSVAEPEADHNACCAAVKGTGDCSLGQQGRNP